jgi:hypothetical protein
MAISGSCLCGAVTYEVDATLSDAGNCHCQMCRKQHGAAFGSYATVDPDHFRWVSGADEVSRYESSPNEYRIFCRVCGSTLGDMSNDSVSSITLGTVDGDPGVRPLSHIFVGSKASWYQINDDLPRFEEWPPGENWI